MIKERSNMNKKEFVCQAIQEKQQFFNAVSDEV